MEMKEKLRKLVAEIKCGHKVVIHDLRGEYVLLAQVDIEKPEKFPTYKEIGTCSMSRSEAGVACVFQECWSKYISSLMFEEIKDIPVSKINPEDHKAGKVQRGFGGAFLFGKKTPE